ncbi:MAG: pectate lyase [Marinilabiliaceae bacterium]|nr:pectate lyase [Marinilabiliaceae bacterium]
MMQLLKCNLLLFTFLITINSNCQVLDYSWKQLVRSSNGEWYKSQEAIDIAENVLLYQRNIGGWPKNTKMHKKITEKEKQELIQLKQKPNGCTTDNGATVLEMTFLSKIYKETPDERYKQAFLLALNYLLDAQYDNGGWPQFYPLIKGYYTHITYNDDSMVNIMFLLKNLFKKTGVFSIEPSEDVLSRAKTAFDKGIECIIKTQYKQNGVLTAWCAQHDETTFLPAKARAYELPSLSGQESAGIVLLLMSIDNPSTEIKTAINSAVTWFEKTKITGLKVERYKNEKGEGEKRLIKDENATPLWARFMNLEDNSPFFCDRDGVIKTSLMEIGRERRNGYKWYSDTPNKVLRQYTNWKEKWD